MLSGRGSLNDAPDMHSPGQRHLLAFIAIGAVLAGALLYALWRAPEPIPLRRHPLEIHVLDVGQGDSLLIISPMGKAVLIDAGPPEAADTVLAALRREKVHELNLVVATHPHADHIGGMVDVLETFPVKLFLDSGQVHPTRTVARMLETIRERGIAFLIAEPGQEFELEEGITLRVLAPMKPRIVRAGRDRLNANSIVLLLTDGSFSLLLTGDSERETEKRLLRTYPSLSANILKVAHHGSRYATSRPFLERLRPEVAIISCGAGNPYGHPAQETLDRLRAVVPTLYRTDLHGEITISVDRRSYWIETEYPTSADVWVGRSSGHRSVEDRATEVPERAFR